LLVALESLAKLDGETTAPEGMVVSAGIGQLAKVSGPGSIAPWGLAETLGGHLPGYFLPLSI
jgi:hypothetical protein